MSDISLLKKKSVNLFKTFQILQEAEFINGNFSLVTNSKEWDLYGSIDAAYIYWMLNELENVTDQRSRKIWADRILSCQDDNGWFTKRNLRGHSKEHATAYAIAALKLLEVDDSESYVSKVKPLSGIKEIFSNRKVFNKWIDRLGFKLTFNDPIGHAGWHYIWRSSHLGGGIAAALGMTKEFHDKWWPESNTAEWFSWYFQWLDAEVNPKTGYWQKAVWNKLIPGPTLIDMAGAVHFYWIYEKYGHPLPCPEQIIESTLKVQKETGLYRNYPMCIDLDGNFCLIRAFNQLSKVNKKKYFSIVNKALENNFDAVVSFLCNHQLEEIYDDSHGLPGALAALAECQNFTGFSKLNEASNFKNPFDKVWWL